MPRGECSLLLRCSSRKNVAGGGAGTWFCRLDRVGLGGSRGVQGGTGVFLLLPPVSGEGWRRESGMKEVGRISCKHSRNALLRIHGPSPNKLPSRVYPLLR